MQNDKSAAAHGTGRNGWAAIERRLLDQVAPGLIGYRGLVVGPMPADTRSELQMGTLCCWHIDRRPGPGIDAVYDGAHLPVASQSVDVLVLSHALEDSKDPHRLVRECARVLSHRGQWLSLVYNPIAPARVARELWRHQAMMAFSRPVPRAARLIDWLRLIEFETTDAWRYGPVASRFTHRPLALDTPWLWPLGWTMGGYGILARRRALRAALPGKRQPAARPRVAALARRTHSHRAAGDLSDNAG